MLTYWLVPKYTEHSLNDGTSESLKQEVLNVFSLFAALPFPFPLPLTVIKCKGPGAKGHSAFSPVFQSSHASAAKAQAPQC